MFQRIEKTTDDSGNTILMGKAESSAPEPPPHTMTDLRKSLDAACDAARTCSDMADELMEKTMYKEVERIGRVLRDACNHLADAQVDLDEFFATFQDKFNSA